MFTDSGQSSIGGVEQADDFLQMRIVLFFSVQLLTPSRYQKPTSQRALVHDADGLMKTDDDHETQQNVPCCRAR